MHHASRFALALAAILASGAASAQAVQIQTATPYAEDADVSSRIRGECTALPTQLPAFIGEFGGPQGVEVTLSESVDATAAGRVLVLEITDAVSMGNAFIGHQKSVTIRGTLFEDGAQVARFRAARNSMGGAFGGFKGSCSVLGRNMRALGRDVATWLAAPVDGARLGNLED